MIRSLLAILLLMFGNYCFSQQASNKVSGDCAALIRSLSDDWKRDSTGNNGFRMENAEFLLRCICPELTKEFIIEYLGNPNEISKEYKGTELCYYYYDFRTLPKGKTGVRACKFIYFFFKEGQNTASIIGDGDIDL